MSDLLQGDTLVVVKKDPSGWWTGEVSHISTHHQFDGRQGLFPSNYVEEV